ncbi:predicted protein [Streptomyces pristinaespiralis ATCC 25486]|uniref:Predicted protein n=2 Tax=Streptomyces pristinaespiralis TaxID=38300 RepID=D6X8L4_STRE2|nr:methyltransferase [Streptomyces pristinaespiralis]EFH31760.1 predicted protein [Streptomyces pristinaespiralis ATCC 25486]
MPFDHNDHYHRLLLHHAPRGGGAALDVGCGTGRFARRLAGIGLEVEDVARLSPFVRQHVNMLGRYSFQLSDLPGRPAAPVR